MRCTEMARLVCAVLNLLLPPCTSHPFVVEAGPTFARGGSMIMAEEGSKSLSVGEIKIIDDDVSEFQCKASFLSTTSETLESILPNDAGQSLAIISDVLILTLAEPSSTHVPPSLVEAITNASERRRQGGYSKLSLLVVLETATTDSEQLNLWKERILTHDLQSITPDVVESLDVTTVSGLDDVLGEIMSDQTGRLVDGAEMFAALLNQVYRSLTNNTATELALTAVGEIDPPSMEDDILVEQALEAEQEPKEEIESGYVEEVLQEALDQIDDLESQQEDVWLNVRSQVPILHFGPEADKILKKASDGLRSLPVKDKIMQRLGLQLKALYQDQLHSLREFYGRKYEEILAEKPHDEKALRDAAARFTDAFRSAAQHSVPSLGRDGQPLEDIDFSYVTVLQGLISDMMEATSLNQSIDSDLAQDHDDDESDRPAKSWYRKLANRALMLGINYLQGWLAYQGIRRAAAKRDRDMPKFPLF